MLVGVTSSTQSNFFDVKSLKVLHTFKNENFDLMLFNFFYQNHRHKHFQNPLLLEI